MCLVPMKQMSLRVISWAGTLLSEVVAIPVVVVFPDGHTRSYVVLGIPFTAAVAQSDSSCVSGSAAAVPAAPRVISGVQGAQNVLQVAPTQWWLLVLPSSPLTQCPDVLPSQAWLQRWVLQVSAWHSIPGTHWVPSLC